MTTTLHRDHVVEWSVASRALPGQSVSGDLHVVAPWANGVLLAGIDGLGHGDEATAAARKAAEALQQKAGESVISLVQHCHRALRDTRGVVMTLVSVDVRDDRATAIGIGNVETMLLRANPATEPRRESVLLRGGVVGYQLPALQSSTFDLGVGDVVVFATDGVREDFTSLVNPADPLEQVVDRVLARNFRGTDDGLVFACRYLGKP